VSRVDGYACAEVPRRIVDAVYSATCSTSVKTGVATVQSWVEDHGGREAAAVICDYLQHGPRARGERVFPAETGVFRYQLLRSIKEYDPDAKPLMTAFMLPVLPAGYIPDVCIANERAAVAARVAAPIADHRKIKPPAPRWLYDTMAAFVKLVVPKFHEGQPLEIQDVYERQARPSQRSLLERASGMLPPKTSRFSTFLKAEPYQKAADPRVISVFNTVDKREYSRFIYAFADFIMATCPWYSFGKKPVDIANKVVTICAAAEEIACADASKMDGHLSEEARQLELALLLAFFHTSHHEKIRALHSRTYAAVAATTLLVQYLTEFTRGSGVPDTALMNSIVSKYVDFTYRVRLMPAKEAYEVEAEFGGDDSIAPLIPGHGPSELIKCAAMIGQNYEVDVFKRGQHGVNYLSRFFTEDVWTGDNSSTCDLVRQLSKLHLSGNDPTIPGDVRLQRKLSGYARTDSNTPIMRNILDAARRVGMDLNDAQYSDSWWAMYDQDVNWPNEIVKDEEFTIQRFLPGADVESLICYLQMCDRPGLLSMPAIMVAGAPKVNKRFTTIFNADQAFIQEGPGIEAAHGKDGDDEEKLSTRAMTLVRVNVCAETASIFTSARVSLRKVSLMCLESPARG